MLKNIKYKKELLLMASILFLGSFFIFQKIWASEKVLFSEFMYNPEGTDSKNEWFEIYNPTSKPLDLSECGLMEENSLVKHKISPVNGDNSLDPDEFGVVCDNLDEFLRKYPDFDGKIFDSSFSLNNNSEEIKLLDEEGEEIASAKYSSSKGADGNGYSLELEEGRWRESYVLGGTPGEKNSEKPEDVSYSEKIRINEIFPNPSGDERRNEFVELYNDSDEIVILEDWILKDSSKSSKFVFRSGEKIKSKDYLIIYRDDFDFAMNNSGDESVSLLNPRGEIVSTVSYESARENVSYGFDDESDKWRWSRYLTPEKKNKFSKMPEFEIIKDEEFFEGIYGSFEVKFESGETSNTKISWDFGDGKRSYKQETKHKYEKAGSYTVSLVIFTGSEEIKKSFKTEVGKFPKMEVRIERIMPNPEGKDSDKEWIEIENKSKKEVNLKNWSIATGTSSKKLTNHPISKDFFINSGESEKITRKFCSFSLPNKKGRIEVRYPDGSVAYRLKYKKEKGVKDDEVYEKKNGKWVWSEGVSDDKIEEVKDLSDKDVDLGDEEILEKEDNKEEIEVNNGGEQEIAPQVLGEKRSNVNSDSKKIFLSVQMENGKNKTFVASVFGGKTHQGIKKEQKHYARVFLEKINAKINRFLNK